jgi:hypothetical protein
MRDTGSGSDRAKRRGDLFPRDVRKLGVRVGNWLTAEEGKKLLGADSAETLRRRRNRALLPLLTGCDHLTVRGFRHG